MNESKRSKPQVQDRLSELPNSVIFHILWFVPMNDVVRTTILSKRWRNLWTTLPFLNFDSDTPALAYHTDKFRNFVNRVLIRWNGIRVLKFKVDSCFEHEKNSIYSDIDLWLNFAKEKRVEELFLNMRLPDFERFRRFDSANEIYWVPQCLFSCSSIKNLSFKACNFTMTRNVEWNQLKSLTITGCFGVTEHAINQILSGSPHLEVLNLSFVDRGENLNIQSSTLKELEICKYLYERESISLVSELTIWTPNLETLKITGIPYTNCRLIDVSSLTHATIGFYGQIYWGTDGCNFSGIDLGNDNLSSDDYIGDKFSQILQTIQHVESVTLFYCCLKVLRAMKMRCMHSSFPNVKSLTVRCCYENYEPLVGLLEIFPQLERLVLEDEMEDDCQDDLDAVKYETSIPKPFLMQLRTIEVTWCYGDSIFPVIEIFLKFAINLEKMTFQIEANLHPKSILLASKKLLNIPRSSPNCKIDFLHFDL